MVLWRSSLAKGYLPFTFVIVGSSPAHVIRQQQMICAKYNHNCDTERCKLQQKMHRCINVKTQRETRGSYTRSCLS